MWTTEQPLEQKPHAKDVDTDEPGMTGLTTEKLVSVDIRTMSLRFLDVKLA